MYEIDYLVIKLTSEDGSGEPIGEVESPPMLWLTLKERNPGFSWSYPPIASEVEQFGYGLFEWNEEPRSEDFRIPYTKDTYTKSYKREGLVKHSDNVWRPTWTQIEATQEEINQRTQFEKERLIRDRNRSLRQSDFSQGLDAPDYVKTKQSEWNTYRQALRDLPTQAGFPWDIAMPVKPTK
jgi:hypothetical protein